MGDEFALLLQKDASGALVTGKLAIFLLHRDSRSLARVAGGGPGGNDLAFSGRTGFEQKIVLAVTAVQVGLFVML